MDREEFAQIRHLLGKSQKQMAQLLGISLKAVQSFEQGWRNIPVHAERQILFLLAKKRRKKEKAQNCWAIMNCPMERRKTCPSWEFDCGDSCWFISGTMCHGEVNNNWEEKMKKCRECKVLKVILPDEQ